MRVALPGKTSAGKTSAGKTSAGEAGQDGCCGGVIDLSGYSGSIEQDLERRDFTINAMAVPLSEWDSDDFGGRLIDRCGGRGDLFRKAIRAVGPEAFRDDPCRILRAGRLSGGLGMRIEPDTVRLMMASAFLTPSVSPSRVRDEFLKILAPAGARPRIEALDHLGVLRHVIPELMAAKGVSQPGRHYWDVWGHALHTVQAAEGVTGGHQNSPVFSCVPWTPETEARFAEVVSDGHTRRTILKLAALFHDIAKPQTKSLEPDGRTRFFGHSEQGAAVAESRLAELRLSRRGIDMVSRMVWHHLRPAGMAEDGKWPTRRAVYRYFRDVGDVAIDTLYLCMADYLGTKGPELKHPEWLEHAKMLSHVLQAGTSEPVAVNNKPRLVSGKDLMSRFNLQPGPRIGALLETVEEARAAGEIETQEQALELVAATLESQGHPCARSRASSV